MSLIRIAFCCKTSEEENQFAKNYFAVKCDIAPEFQSFLSGRQRLLLGALSQGTVPGMLLVPCFIHLPACKGTALGFSRNFWDS